MPSKKTVKASKPEVKLDPVFSNLEFSRRADELIGVIKRHFQMIKGVNVEREETLQIATDIIKGRLK